MHNVSGKNSSHERTPNKTKPRHRKSRKQIHPTQIPPLPITTEHMRERKKTQNKREERSGYLIMGFTFLQRRRQPGNDSSCCSMTLLLLLLLLLVPAPALGAPDYFLFCSARSVRRRRCRREQQQRTPVGHYQQRKRRRVRVCARARARTTKQRPFGTTTKPLPQQRHAGRMKRRHISSISLEILDEKDGL